MPQIKLPPEEAKRRAYEQSKRSNAIKKAKRDAERLLGIPPTYKKLTPQKRLEATTYQRERRRKISALKPKRIPMTKEEKRLRAIEKSRKQYEVNLAKLGKTRKIPVVKRPREPKTKPVKVIKPKSIRVAKPKPIRLIIPKPPKMEKLLKSRPANRISEKVIKPIKIDATKQPDVVQIKSSDAGKIKVRLDSKTEVYVKPGYVLENLKRKFNIL